jgi:phosphotriesterase-related protein
VPTVETVKGPVDLDALGTTLMHEHVFVMQPEPLASYVNMFGGGYWDEEERLADAIAKLTRLREGGISTIVEPTAFGLGRNIERVQRINARWTSTSSSRPASTRSSRCPTSSPIALTR